LLVVGDGPAREELLAVGRELGIADRIKITGRVKHDEIPAHVAAMDVAVSPRATFYASPMKIAEYMAGGRAVIAPRMANIEDMVDDGRTGLLFEPESAESLARALRRALESAPLRRRLGRAAREEVEARLNWSSNARRIAEIAKQAILQRSRELLKLPPPHARAA
ncbi:MAG TPA: glycosyltransferase, partial [Planctomycetota bacterium]|nr:glycosyltransferase [Planctomycetota bacterium]